MPPYIYLSIYQSLFYIYLSIYLSLFLSIYLYIGAASYLRICRTLLKSIYLSFLPGGRRVPIRSIGWSCKTLALIWLSPPYSLIYSSGKQTCSSFYIKSARRQKLRVNCFEKNKILSNIAITLNWCLGNMQQNSLIFCPDLLWPDLIVRLGFHEWFK